MTYYIKVDDLGSTLIVLVTDMGQSFIPEDAENTDYQRYLAWLAEGNSPLPWPPVS